MGLPALGLRRLGRLRGRARFAWFKKMPEREEVGDDDADRAQKDKEWCNHNLCSKI